MGRQGWTYCIIAIAALALPAAGQQKRVKLVWSVQDATVTDAQFLQMLDAVLGQHPKISGKSLADDGAMLDRWASDAKYLHRLQEAAGREGRLSKAQLQKDLSRLEGQLREVEGQLQFLEGLSHARDRLWPAMLAERLESLERDRQRLETELSAKSARAEAVRQAIAQRREELATQAQSDPVMPQLQVLVEQRKQELQRVEQMRQKDVASAAELATAKANLDLADMRLSERTQLLSRQDTSGLLDRLRTELALVTIDLAELRARQEYLQRQGPPLDPAGLTAEQVQSLATEYQPWYDVQIRLPPIYIKLQEQRNGLLKQRFALLVDRVEVLGLHSAEATASGR